MKLPKPRKEVMPTESNLCLMVSAIPATRDTPKECEQWAALKILELKANAGDSVAEETKPVFTFKELFDEYFESRPPLEI